MIVCVGGCGELDARPSPSVMNDAVLIISGRCLADVRSVASRHEAGETVRMRRKYTAQIIIKTLMNKAKSVDRRPRDVDAEAEISEKGRSRSSSKMKNTSYGSVCVKLRAGRSQWTCP